MKTILSWTRYLLAVLLMLVGVLLTCYSAIANARLGGMRNATNVADVSPGENDNDSEYLEKRRAFLDRFFGTGPGSVSPSAYKNAVAAARALPPSSLLQGRRFMSPKTLEGAPPWNFPIPPPIQNSYGVSAIAVNPGASNDVYVGTGREGSGAASYEVGLYRSFDGGSTWSSALGKAQFEGTYIRTIAIDPNTSSSQSSTTVYAANGGTNTCGLWRSTDSGVTWLQLYQVDNGVYDVAIDAATHPSTLYITEDNGTFKSTDSGRSWTLIHSVLEHSRNRLSVANSTLYLLGPGDPDHNLYKSMDGGATWIQIPTRCPCAPDVCANDNPPGPPICADSCASRCGNIGFSVFAVDPVDPQIILGGNQALYRTDNEGATWTEIGNKWGNDPDPARRIHTDQRAIVFSRTAPSVVYGGIVRSSDAGLHWTNLNQNFPGALLYGVALSADGNMVAGTQDNGVVFSGASAPWDMIFGGDS